MWDFEEFREFGLALYPILLLPEVNSKKSLRQVVAEVQGSEILEPTAFIAPSYGGVGTYEKESDATILYDEMEGFTSKGVVLVEPLSGMPTGSTSGEALVAKIIKRRSGAFGGKNDLHNLYDEYNKVVARREGRRIPELKDGKMYYHDLIDWLEDEASGFQIGGSGDLQKSADMVRKALDAKNKKRYSPGTPVGTTTNDAASLYTAMAGEDKFLIPKWFEQMGTDEGLIDAVLERRKNDIPELYFEYNNYLAQKGEVDDGDLIDWLEGEGETRSAQIVAKALEDEGMERYKPGERRKISKKKSLAIGTGVQGMSKKEKEDLFFSEEGE